MARRLSPRKLTALRNDLIAFHNMYVEYLELTWPPKGAGRPARATELRAELLSRLAGAQAALAQAGVHLALTPAPAIGGPMITGLGNLLFVHETPRGYTGIGAPFCANVEEAMRIGDGYLAKQEEEERRRRRNPIWWLDLIVTWALGFPAYILSRILGVPVARIEESPFSFVLRVLALGVDGALVYLGIKGAG